MSSNMIVAAFLGFVLVAVSAEVIEECTCSQVERCRMDARKLLSVCAKQCEVMALFFSILSLRSSF